MFVAGEVQAEVGFALAQARLAHLARAGSLLGASQGAYRTGLAGLLQADPPDPPSFLPGMAGLVRAQFADLVPYRDSARLALRWQAAAPGGELFPALDADITLSPDGDHVTTLALAGVYRLPPGTRGNGLGQAPMRRAASATIQAFLDRIANAITVVVPALEHNGGAGPPPHIAGSGG